MILSRFITPMSLYQLAFVTVFPLSRPLCLVRAFHNNNPSATSCYQVRKFHSLFSSASDTTNDGPYNIKAASVKLVWETLEESSNRPVLDLSSRDASPEDANGNNEEEEEEWALGQKWQTTKTALEELGILKEDNDNEQVFLEICPQLLRLDTEMIVETAEWILQEFGNDYFAKQPTAPKLLSYRLADVQYGVEFMSMMMMNNAKPFCQNSADFFQTAIDGGIQERSVSNALGAASAATYQANQKVAGDAMSSLQSLKKNRSKKGL